MHILLDTCALSEYTQKVPNQKVIAYLDSLDLTLTYLSSVSLAEIWKGIEELPLSRRRTNLEIWFRKDVLIWYAGRILPFDEDVALHWGTMNARLLHAGFPMGYADSLIAATAFTHGLAIITRNESDFAHCGVKIVNPWK